jgi:hypothetical protein
LHDVLGPRRLVQRQLAEHSAAQRELVALAWQVSGRAITAVDSQLQRRVRVAAWRDQFPLSTASLLLDQIDPSGPAR